MATKKKTDLSAALTGLILGAVTLFLLLTSIVGVVRARLTPRVLLGLNRFSGAVLVVFGLRALLVAFGVA